MTQSSLSHLNNYLSQLGTLEQHSAQQATLQHTALQQQISVLTSMSSADYQADGSELEYINQCQANMGQYLSAPASADNASLGQSLSSQLSIACSQLISDPAQASTSLTNLSAQLTQYHTDQQTAQSDVNQLRQQYNRASLAPSDDYLSHLARSQQQIMAISSTNEANESSQDTDFARETSTTGATRFQSLNDTSQTLSENSSVQEWVDATNQQFEYQYGLRAELSSMTLAPSSSLSLSELTSHSYLCDYLSSGTQPSQQLYQSNIQPSDFQTVSNYLGASQQGDITLSDDHSYTLSSIWKHTNPQPYNPDSSSAFSSEPEQAPIDTSKMTAEQKSAYQGYVSSLTGWLQVEQEAQATPVATAFQRKYQQYQSQWARWNTDNSSQYSNSSETLAPTTAENGQENMPSSPGSELLATLNSHNTLLGTPLATQQMTQAKNMAFNQYMQSLTSNQLYQTQAQYLAQVSQYTPWLAMASASSEQGQSSEYSPMLQSTKDTETSLTQLYQYAGIPPEQISPEMKSAYDAQYQQYQQHLSELQGYQSQAMASQQALTGQCQCLHSYLNGTQNCDYQQIISQSEQINQFTSAMPNYAPLQQQYQSYQNAASGSDYLQQQAQSHTSNYTNQAYSQLGQTSAYQQYQAYQSSNSGSDYLQQQLSSQTGMMSNPVGPYTQMLSQLPSQDDIHTSSQALIHDQFNQLKTLSSQLPTEQYANTCLSPQLCSEALDSLNQINKAMSSVLSSSNTTSTTDSLDSLVASLCSKGLNMLPISQISSWVESLSDEVASKCKSWASSLVSNTPTQLSFTNLPALTKTMEQEFDHLKSQIGGVVNPLSQSIASDMSDIKHHLQQWLSSSGESQSSFNQTLSHISSMVTSLEQKLDGYKQTAMNGVSDEYGKAIAGAEHFFGPMISSTKGYIDQATAYLQGYAQNSQQGMSLWGEIQSKAQGLLSQLPSNLSLNLSAFSSLSALQSSIENMLTAQQQFYSLDQAMALKDTTMSSLLGEYDQIKSTLTQLTSQLAPCPNINEITQASAELEQNMQAYSDMSTSVYEQLQDVKDDPYSAASAPTLDQAMDNVSQYQQSVQQQAVGSPLGGQIVSQVQVLNEQVTLLQQNVATLKTLNGEANQMASAQASASGCGNASVTCMNSMMMCSFAVAPSTYMSIRPTVLINNNPATTINDCIPIVNITPFPGCIAPTNPDYPTNPTVNSCVPELSEFIPTKVLVQIQGEPVNTLNNIAMCEYASGGVVQFVNPVQMTTFTQ
ncbi:DUF4280 domain-containing protein [Vibrio sp. S4M6]|uniref:DUF4280 domain-containing protein n=1 Tax=Vibrio sinus TaxID=2946865 RepID=UPI00202A9381|nr:DUF4280 domain-containing protein [Vibrio sinus]MCL9781011.1 DUF4280 domain-containing protein [Vibrio sinus]